MTTPLYSPPSDDPRLLEMRRYMAFFEEERFVLPNDSKQVAMLLKNGFVTLKVDPPTQKTRAVLTEKGCHYIGLNTNGRRLPRLIFGS